MSADELLLRLDELGAELKVRDRPERRAWNRLEPTKSGWTTRLYDDQAFELWNEVLRRFPDDLRSVHHLAIMHHARAIDAEQSDHPRQSDGDWRQALAHWHRLFEAEKFWAELSERVDAAPDLLPQVRQDLAERLLRVHFDIALDEQSPHHRARFHVRLALDSPFPRDLVEQVRVKAYERAIEGLDAAVWAPNTFEPEVLWPGIETVTHYLDRDQDCAAALNDLLRLLKQVQTGQVQHANGIIHPEEMSRALDEIRATARQYDGFVSRLELLLLDAAERNPLVLSDLALWHFRVGQACNVRHAYDEAAGYYDRALRAARAGADPWVEEFRVEWLFSTVLAAREHAVDDRERARRLLASIMKSERLPGVVLLARAQTWMLLGDFDKAERDAKDASSALKSPQKDTHGLWGEDPVELRAECQKLLRQISQVRLVQKVTPHMNKAEDAMKSARWAEAIRALDTVLVLDKDFVPALIRRAECRLGQYETDAADADLDRADRLNRAAVGDEQALQAVRQLREVLISLRKHVTTYGGPNAARLRQEGIKASNDGRHDKAIELLRSARAAARPRATKKLDEDLAQCLNAAACELVDSLLDTPRYRGLPIDESVIELLRPRGLAFGDRLSGPLATVRRAEEMLTEATSLHASQAIDQNLSQVMLLRRRLEYLW